MDYQKTYNALCAKGIARIEKGGKKKLGYEDHHILPKCLGGDNAKSNITRLTAREHFLAHWLLTKLHPGSKGLRLAMWRMVNAQAKGGLNSRMYAALREWYAEEKRKELTERHSDPVYMAEKRVRSAAIIAKTGAAKMSMLAKAKLTELRKDPSYVERHKINHREVVARKVVCQETGIVFNALVDAANWLKTEGYPNAMGNKIGMCCAGKLKRAYGYTWQYA